MPLDPQDLGDLIAIRDAGTLSAAAKARGVAVSTVSRRIETLETALGLPLVDRRTDGVRLTGAGLAIAEAASPIAEQMRRVERVAESLRQGSKTVPVRISAVEFVISDILAPALDRLWMMGADFPVQLQSQADVVSLAARDADLAIRMVRPEGASLYARKLADIRLGLFASADYLAGRDPAAIDLKAERLLIYDDSYGRLPELAWVTRDGLADAVAMRTGSTRGLLAAALAGAGIALLPVPFALRAGGLIEIPPPSALPSRQPWLIVHRDLRGLPAIRLAQKWVALAFASLR
ncbi:LysR family transcriptional regulator [Erythrobacter sp. GH1-10]|uniref:LysR family transcriptional regulator n=1 Tax=Erythrobacter sp. GH1-10 TaxID=3349334 RepID=UPI003877C431